MKRCLFVLLATGMLVSGLFSCTDPATDIKDGEGETMIVDSTNVPPSTTENPSADTSVTPVLADTTMQR